MPFTLTPDAIFEGLPALSSPWRGLQPGARIDEFEVRQLIAQGGLGQVYLARDVRLGRLAAIKVIRPDRLRPDRLQRFVEEARITASFNHPNIVVVYGLGAVDGQLYIALEYLDGEGLDQRIARGRLGMRESLRLIRDVVRGLSEAHLHGVVHRDVKPGNVVIPKDGRPRVVDFGLATRLVETGDGRVVGTPLYLAPEVWRGHEGTAASDIFAVGLMLMEMLAGAHPLRASHNHELATLSRRAEELVAPAAASGGWPTPLAGLLRRCLRLDPAERPTAQSALEALDVLIDGPSAEHPEHNPFRGLLPFEESHAADFVGREDELLNCLEVTRRQPVLAVVGPSGAGKSSFVCAGLLPRLRERGDLHAIVIRPGALPFEALARGILAVAPDRPETPAARPQAKQAIRRDADLLSAELEASPRATNLQLHELAARLGKRVVLVVDQLEEVVTQGGDPSLFVEAIATAAEEPDGPVLVVATAREDFLGRLVAGPAARRLLESLLVLARPRGDALRLVLTEPLRRVGYTYEDPAIVEEMVAEVRDAPAALPLLQFVCHELWDRRDRSRQLILRDAWVTLGGVGGALTHYADQIMTELGPAQRDEAKQICLRLVSPDGARQPVTAPELVAGLGPEAPRVLDALTASRLLTVRRQADGESPVVELSHDSLVRTWPILRRWLLEHDQDLALCADLEAAAALWEKHGRRPDETWRDRLLDNAAQRVAGGVVVSPRALAFVKTGSAWEIRRRRVRRGAIVALVAGLLAVTVGSLVVAARIRAQAQRIDQARADIGAFTVVFEPFDWDPEKGRVDVPVSALPELRLTLYTADRDDPRTPGALLDPSVSRVEPQADGSIRVEARGGLTHLRVDGRNATRGGRASAPCGPSWLMAWSLPGYAERDAHTYHIPIPTCAASRAGTVAIPAGEYISNGVGEPPDDRAEYIQPEAVATLPAFALDRTELPNALLAVFAANAALTRIGMPQYPESGPLAEADGDWHPATGLDAYDAEAVCRYLGKRLPSSAEWEKAFRGGLRLAEGRPNPHPRRNLPWEPGLAGLPANLAGASDGYDGTAPVFAFPAGASPYGLLNMVGNVAEWTSTWRGARRSLRRVRGESWDSVPAARLHWLSFENSRSPRFFDFATGVRCASECVAGQTCGQDESAH